MMNADATGVARHSIGRSWIRCSEECAKGNGL